MTIDEVISVLERWKTKYGGDIPVYIRQEFEDKIKLVVYEDYVSPRIVVTG